MNIINFKLKREMKKSYLTLAAVAMVMASCSNEVLVDNQEVKNNETEAMTFSTFSDLAVKGDATVRTNLEYYHNTFAVYGSKKSTVDDEVTQPFDAQEVTYNSTAATALDDWKYSPLRYWDRQANYNFIAVAPSNAIVKYQLNDVLYTDATEAANAGKNVGDVKVAAAEREIGEGSFVTVAGGYTLVGQNLQTSPTAAEIVKGFVGGTGKDTDIMTSTKVAQNGSTHIVGQAVNLTFKHILAKLNIAIAKHSALDDVVITIKEVSIAGLDNNGTYLENANGGAWSNQSTVGSYSLVYDNTNGQAAGEINSTTKLYFIESLVMPQVVADDVETVTVKYSITSGTAPNTVTENFTYRMDLYDAFKNNFVEGNNYTLTFNIMPDAIVFDASATEWVDKDANGTIVVQQ